MKLCYTVSAILADDGSKVWYAHAIGYSNIPAMDRERGTFTAKRTDALHTAAEHNGLSYKDYMALRKENKTKC